MSTKNEIKIIRKRFKCPKCRIIESHSIGSSKTSCSKCGSPFIEISEKEYQQIKLKQKKDLIEDIKETNNTEKKKKKSSHKNITNEESDSEQKEKKKVNLKEIYHNVRLKIKNLKN